MRDCILWTWQILVSTGRDNVVVIKLKLETRKTTRPIHLLDYTSIYLPLHHAGGLQAWNPFSRLILSQ